MAHTAAHSKSYLSEIEAGQNAPSLNMLRALAEELGVEPWVLIKPADPDMAGSDPDSGPVSTG